MTTAVCDVRATRDADKARANVYRASDSTLELPPVAKARMIAVTSGKGGVGKSNMSLGLAILLSAAGSRVILVDADIGLGNLDVLMGVQGGLTLAEAVGRQLPLRRVLVDLPYGVRLAAGDTGMPGGAGSFEKGRAGVIRGIHELRTEADFVILDCGSGIGRDVTDFCALAEHVIVVTTPEPTALMDGYGLIKSAVLDGYAGRLSVLVNLAADRIEAKASYARIAGVAAQFLGRTVFDAGYVLADPKVPAAVRQRRPFVLAYPRCPASRCLAALAAKLRPRNAAFRPDADRGWLRRLAGWFG